MMLEISRCVSEAIHAAADASPDREVCGLLFGSAARITAHLACRNVAPDPHRSFEIDPQALIAAHRAARGGGPAIVGCYHSHPVGPAVPSPRDAAAAEPNGWIWLIVGRGAAGCWRAGSTGFEPVPFAVATFG